MADRVDSQHVDLVLTEWQAGQQVLIARAIPIGGAIKVVVFHGSGNWESTLSQPIDIGEDRPLYPQDDPPRFLSLLHTKINGSDYFVTELHGDEDCDFDSKEFLRFKHVAAGLMAVKKDEIDKPENKAR